MFLLASFLARASNARRTSLIFSLSLSLSFSWASTPRIYRKAMADHSTLLISRLITEQLKWRSLATPPATRRTSIDYK